MSAIQKIFQKYGPLYLERFGKQMPHVHQKVMRAIMECQCGSLGTLVYQCQECGGTHTLDCACGNRHCPSCQHTKGVKWLEEQIKKRLPTHYFLLTFTLPQALRRFVRSHQRLTYDALFSCARDSLKTLALDKRFIGSSQIGYLAVLHTWGASLQYHPHLHLVIPGGAVSEDRKQWIPSRQDLFVHTKPLAIIFKAKFRDVMKKAGLFEMIDPCVWLQNWVVDSQSAGQGQNALRYLSRYVFRVAISNNRIKNFDQGTVTFQYKDKVRKKWKNMTLDAMEFIRRFLQHVLPTGFMKVRHIGFMNANSTVSIDKIKELISLIQGVIPELLPKILSKTRPKLKCSICQQALHFLFFLKPIPRKGPSG